MINDYIIKINHIASIKQTGIYLRIFQDDNIVNHDNANKWDKIN